MGTECIYNVDLTTNNKDIISVSSDSFNHFYIANINDDGDETNYLKVESNDSLSANFFMIKILKDNTPGSVASINRLLNRKDIVKVGVNFTNGRYQEFEVAKKRIASNGSLINKYEDAFLDNDDLCIIITDKKIKYTKNLFV